MRKGLIGLAITMIFTAAAWAGDGIPMGNAVFYPSVEAVYTHTDNLFLQDKTMPLGNESDSFWLVRPMMGFEFPFKESYVRLDLAYQYKDYEHFRLSSHDTYEANLVGSFSLGRGYKLTVRNEYLQGVQEVQKFDPGYEQPYGNTEFHANHFRAGLQMPMGQLNSLEVYGLYNQVNFAGGDNPYAVRPFFSYKQTGGGLTFRHNYNPESDWLVDMQYLNSRPVHQAADLNLYTPLDKKYDSWKLQGGWEGAINRNVAGYAKAGYEKMHFTQNNQSDFGGLVVDTGLGFTPSEFFKVNLDLNRQPYQSAFSVNNYYTATSGELRLHHELSRLFYWSAGYHYQENSYPDRVNSLAISGDLSIPTEVYPTFGQNRLDKISRAFGEFGFHFSKQISLKANYQYEDRNSNIRYYDHLGTHRPYSYNENRFMVQAQLGW